jgi:hypothetical protein
MEHVYGRGANKVGQVECPAEILALAAKCTFPRCTGKLQIQPIHSCSGRQSLEMSGAAGGGDDSSRSAVPSGAAAAVLKPSQTVPDGTPQVSGINFDQYSGRDITASELLAGMTNMGFQASAVAEAVRIINDMVPCAFVFVVSNWPNDKLTLSLPLPK